VPGVRSFGFSLPALPAGAWLFWPREIGRAVLPHRQAAPQRGPTVAAASNHLAAAPQTVPPQPKPMISLAPQQHTQSLNQLLRDRHAILLGERAD